ncbi:MAG: hypothetical protein CMK59_08060 [Proteobacteria bacterium]|nr:hypothetical protein [Pseudomonadota bacterium]
MIVFAVLSGCSKDIEQPQSKEEPVSQVEHWCDGVLGGNAGSSWHHEFARAHVGHRLFGPNPDWIEADVFLSSMVHSEGVDLDAYAEHFSTVCAAESSTSEAQPAQVDIIGSTAVVRPGSDVPDLPQNIDTVLFDLRNPSPDDRIQEAVELALSEDVVFAKQRVRRFLGFPSQEEGWTHYESELKGLEHELSGSASEDLSIAFLTGPTLTPEATRIISGLRMNGMASIIGYDVHPPIGESTWTGIEDQGLLWRYSTLYTTDNVMFPDRIVADAVTTDLDEAVSMLEALDVSPLQDIETTRSELQRYTRDTTPSASLTQKDMLTGLLVAYGTLDWFYPYFEAVGRGIDDALVQEWGVVSTLQDGDRLGMMDSLGRLMHSIHDGHGFYSDWAGSDWPDGYLGVQLQNIDGYAVVRQSVHPELNPGDRIIEVDGVDALDWFEETMSRYSASSEGYRFVLASDELMEVYGSRELVVEDHQGSIRSVSAGPLGYTETMDVPWGGSTRQSGWLDDLDAPSIYYVNMSGMVMPDMETVTDIFDEVQTSEGIVLDMRDYPYLDIYEFARYFNPSSFTAPHFGFPTWSGPEHYELTFEIWSFGAGINVYEQPIAILVSNKSVSAAECFVQMLMPLENVTVVGQQSASTNGTITNAWLPGQLMITFTGMNLLNLDGSDFHGIGVVPDLWVHPTQTDFANGIDPELASAIEVLTVP